MSVDLHTHSTASDGTFAPRELIKLAVKKGLSAVALTDHDTVGGLAEAELAAKELPIKLVPGLEVSTDWRDEEIHILGYYIDRHDKQLQKTLLILEQERLERGKKMVALLKEQNVDISWERVVQLAQHGVVGRPHIARAMLETGLIGNMAEGFERYLAKGRAAYVPRTKLSPQQAIQMIKQAGGVPVLAHPALLSNYKVLGEMLAWGIAGVEVYYPGHDREQQRLFLNWTRQHRLIATGGSDFHGEDRKENSLAAAVVDEKVLSELLNIARGGLT